MKPGEQTADEFGLAGVGKTHNGNGPGGRSRRMFGVGGTASRRGGHSGIGDSFQDLFLLHGPVEVHGALLAGAVAQGVLVLPHLVAGPPGQLEGRAIFLVRAVEDVPAGGQDHEIPEAGQGEAPLVDQKVDLLDLLDVEVGIEAVVGVFFPDGLDEALFFVLPYTLLGEVHQAGDVVDEIEVSAADLFIFSSGHWAF